MIRVQTSRALRQARKNITFGKIAEKLLWIIVIAGGIILTATMTFDLLKQYRDQPVTTAMQLVKNESMVLAVPPVLCLAPTRLYASELWYMQLYDVIPTADDFDYFEREDLTEESFMGNATPGESQWPKFLIRAMDTYFTYSAAGFPLGDSVINAMAKFLLVSVGIPAADVKQRLAGELALVKAESAPSSTPYQNYVKKFFQPSAGISREFLLNYTFNLSAWSDSGHLPWPFAPSWLFVSVTCLNMAARAEIGSAGLTDIAADGTDRQSDDRTAACILLEQNLDRIGVTTDEFRQHFGFSMIIAKSLYHTICPTYNSECNTDYMTNYFALFDRVTHVSATEICYQMNARAFGTIIQFGFYEDTDWAFPQTLLKAFSPTIVTMNFEGWQRDAIAFQADLKNRPVEKTFSRLQDAVQGAPITAYSVSMGDFQSTTVQLSAVFNYLADSGDGQRRCSSQPSQYLCFRDCKVRQIETKLQCTPTSLIPLEEGTVESECRIETLSQWTDFNMSAVLACMKTCQKPCVQWSIQLRGADSGGTVDKLLISSKLSLTRYQFYQEQYTLTAENYIGSFGGVLGLWLGVDIIVATGLLLAPVKFVAEWKEKKKKVAAIRENYEDNAEYDAREQSKRLTTLEKKQENLTEIIRKYKTQREI